MSTPAKAPSKAEMRARIADLETQLRIMGVTRRELEFKLTLPDDAKHLGLPQCLSWYVGPQNERVIVIQPSISTVTDPDGVRDDKGRCNLCGHKPDEIPDVKATAKDLAEKLKTREPGSKVAIAIMPIGSKFQVFEYTRPAEVAE